MRFRRILHRAYSTGSWPRNFGSWRFTRPGLLVLVMLIVSGGIGLDTRTTVVYKGFALLFALLAISMLWGLFFRVNLRLQRQLPRFGTVGEPFEYKLIIQNDSNSEQKGLYFFENLEDPRPTEEEFLYTPEPGEERRNLYDRTLLVYRWYWLISQNQGVKPGEHSVPSLLPHEQSEIRVTATPIRRGYVRFAGVTINRPDPLNLYKAFARFPLPQSLLILPKRYELPPINLPGARKFKLGGIALASSVGDSEEFRSLRDYRPGDPLRHIHWRSWAKIGKPIVKEFQSEYFVRHALVLDTFQQAEYNERFEEAVSVAASFACSIRTQESLLDLMFVGPDAYCFTAGRGLGHTDQMLEILASVKPCRDKSFSVLSSVVNERATWLSGCICILLDWDEARQNFVRELKELNVPLLVFVITDGDGAQPLEPDQMQTENFYQLEVGSIAEGLAKL